MKTKKGEKVLFIILGVIIPLAIVMLFTLLDMGTLFDSWGKQEDGTMVMPGWKYIFLIVFKISLYLLPPLVGMIGFYKENKQNIKRNSFAYYFIKALNFHFLVLLVLKLLADSVFELDRIFGLTLFNSIKEIQTLVGYILTFILMKNIKIEPGISVEKDNNQAEE